MAKQIKTDVTVEEYEFVDANGKHLFTISFHPTDVGIVKRYEKVADHLNNLSAKDLGLDGEDETAAIEAAEKALEEQMNQMFNSDIATPIFAVMSPFTPLASGKLYVEEIMEKIGVLIESEMNVRLEKVQSRMQKYTAKYQK